MNLSFFKERTVSAIEDLLKTDTLQALRLRILNTLLIVSSVAAVIVYFLQLNRSFEGLSRPVIFAFTAIVLWLVIITIFRKIPYIVRAISLTTLVFLLGVASFVLAGFTGDGAILMLTFVFLASLLVGSWGPMVAATSVVLTVIFLAMTMSNHTLIPFGVNSPDKISAWVNRGAVTILLSTAVGMTVTSILRGLQSNLRKATALAEQLEKDQEQLRQRTANLERRSLQIRTAAQIARSISGVLTQAELLQASVDLIQERLGLYYVGVFLLDESERNAVLQAGTGEAGKAMLAEHHRLAVAESSMIGWTIIHRQSRIALDTGDEAIRFANPYLPDTHSEMALPLISGDKVLGALTIQSSQVKAFDPDDITVLENISDTLAIALDNARLFQATQAALEETRSIQRSYMTRAWSDVARQQEKFEYATSSAPSGDESVSAIDVPLTLREQIIGELHLEGDQDWSPEEQSLVEAIASQAALAMENARLLQESQQTALHERLVAEITGKVWASPTTDSILQTALKELARALRADEAVIEIKPE